MGASFPGMAQPYIALLHAPLASAALLHLKEGALHTQADQ